MSVVCIEDLKPAVHAKAPEMTAAFDIEVVREMSELIALRESWERLEAANHGATLFQSYAWCLLAAEVFDENDDCELFICSAYHDNELVALLPLRLLRKRFRTVLTGLAEPFQEFTDMLIAPGISPGVLFAEIMNTLTKAGADVLHFGQVRTDSKLFEALDGEVPAIGEADAAPFVSLDQWEGYSDFLKTVKTKTRKNMRNARNVMERTAPVRCEVRHQGSELDEIIDRTHETRSEWLEEKGLTSSAFSDSQFSSFIQKFKTGRDCSVRSIGNNLYHGDQVIAEQWGFIYRERYYAFISSYNAEYAKVSPGKLHLGEIIKMGFGEGLKTVEFMIPDVPYKRTWASDRVVVQDHVLGFTFKGALYSGLWINVLRPRLKSILVRLPKKLRRGLFALAFGKR